MMNEIKHKKESKMDKVKAITSILNDISAIITRVLLLMLVFMSYEQVYTYFEALL